MSSYKIQLPNRGSCLHDDQRNRERIPGEEQV